MDWFGDRSRGWWGSGCSCCSCSRRLPRRAPCSRSSPCSPWCCSSSGCERSEAPLGAGVRPPSGGRRLTHPPCHPGSARRRSSFGRWSVMGDHRRPGCSGDRPERGRSRGGALGARQRRARAGQRERWGARIRTLGVGQPPGPAVDASSWITGTTLDVAGSWIMDREE